MNDKKQIEEMREMASIMPEAALLACEDLPLMPSDTNVCYNIPCHRCKETRLLVYKGYRKQEWIGVEERVPKKRQKCLCYYPEKDYGSKVVVDYVETDNGGFAEQYQFGKPSHWMPLPKPPKMKGGTE